MKEEGKKERQIKETTEKNRKEDQNRKTYFDEFDQERISSFFNEEFFVDTFQKVRNGS